MKHLFLDTNVFLYYKDFEQIDWMSLLNFKGAFTIDIPEQVIKEIDKLKDQGKDKVKDRARKIASKFGDLFLSGKKCKIPVEKGVHLLNKDFDDTNYDPEQNDDRIILSIIKSGISKSDIFVVSCDNDFLIKAKDEGFNFFRMSKEYRLKEELSEAEKQNKDLKIKLAGYESRKPNPYITFEDDGELLRFRKLKPIDIEIELENFIKQLKKENPYKEYTEEKIDPNMSPQLFLATGYRIKTKEEIQNENKELDLYFKEWEKYKRFYLLKNALDKRFKKIIFKIQNKGNDQTGDMNIFVKIPDRIKIYDKNSKIWMEDTKPERFMFSIHRLNPYMIDRWDTTKTIQNHELKFQESKLNHHLFMHLNSDNPLYIDTDTCGNFEIKWTIIDSKVSNPLMGKLHVVVE